MKAKKTPSWLQQGPDSVTITLSRPEPFNGVKTNKVTLRAPTVRDVRAAQKLHPSDAEDRELALFASLAQVAPTDLEAIKLTDYNRIQEGYFRLTSDDETNAAGAAPSGDAAGS
jgi:hypothetical protein